MIKLISINILDIRPWTAHDFHDFGVFTGRVKLVEVLFPGSRTVSLVISLFSKGL